MTKEQTVKNTERAPSSSILDQGAQEQAHLPTRTAFRLCIQGISTRLGRSVVTLIGVALGIAFLMSVLSGFHIKQALKSEASLKRDVARYVAVLRAQVGRLEDRTIAIIGQDFAPAGSGLIDNLLKRGSRVVSIAGALPPAVERASDIDLLDAHAVLLMGNYAPLVSDMIIQSLSGKRVLVFGNPSTATTEAFSAADITIKRMAIELKPEDIERAALREEQATYRMYWIVAVSLLITIGGISNAMLMSVTERFREIATMKCLGALSGFIVKLFLIESSLMGFAGSVVGCVIGVLFPLIAYSYTFGVGRVLTAVNFGLLGATGFACTVAGVILAIIAAIYPARIASKMVPADALRSQV